MVPVAAVESVRPVPPEESQPRPTLGVVPRRRRWPALIAGFVSLMLLAAMLGAAIFHTQLAERQLEIDALSAQVQSERDRFDQLRLTLAQLGSPDRLTQEGERLGLALAPQTKYLDVDPWLFARWLAAAGPVSDGVGQIVVQAEQLDQFREVKAATAGQP